MSKKHFRLLIAVLLSVMILLGQLLSLPQLLPLKAAEKQAQLVTLKLDGIAIDEAKHVTTNPTSYLELTAKQTGFFAIPFKPVATTIVPLESMDTLRPLEDFQTFEQETFDVKEWQREVLTATLQERTETTETTETSFQSTTDFTEESEEVPTEFQRLPFQTSTVDEQAGVVYFYLEKDEIQTFKVIHDENTTESFVLETVPINETSVEKQTLYTYESASVLASSELLNETISTQTSDGQSQEQTGTSTSEGSQTSDDTDASQITADQPTEPESDPADNLMDEGETIPDPLDQSALSRFDVFTEKESYLIGEEAVGYIALTMNQGTGNLKNAVIEIRIPKEYLKNEPVGSDFALASQVETVLDGDDYVIRYQVPNIEAGYEGQIPFRFQVKAGITPDGYQLPITATILDADKQEEAKAETKVSYRKHQPFLYKQVQLDNGSWSTYNNNTVTVGPEDASNPGHFPGEDRLNELRPVKYRFTYGNYGLNTNSNGYRTYQSWTIEDTIPVEALFRTEDNPGWLFDPVTRIASYQGDLKHSLSTSSTTNNSSELTLYYPAAEIDQRVTNTGTATFVPYQQGEGEEHPTATDNIFHSLVEYKRPTGYTFYKSGGSANYDVLAEKEATKINWNSYILNPNAPLNPEAMENLVIHDYEQDNQLMFQTVQVTSSYSGNLRNQNFYFKGTVTIRLVLDDGSEVILTEDYVPKNTGTNATTSSLILDLPENTKEVIMKSNAGSTLDSGGYLYLRLTSVYRDPVKTTLDDPTVRPTMRNNARGSGNYVNQGHKWTALDNHYHTLKPVNPYVTLAKSRTAGPSPLFIGDISTYRLDVRHYNSVPNQWVKNPIMVDLLPEGFDYVSNSTTITHYNNSMFTYGNAAGSYEKEPEIIPNYEGTGRTALRWRLPEWAYKGDKITSTYYVPYRIDYKTKVTELAKEGRNTNNAYLGWTNNTEIRPTSTSTGGTTDIYDVNENGDRTDKIAASSSTIDYRAPIELITTKEVMGNLDNGYVFEPLTGKTEIASTGSYRLRLLNNSVYDIEHVQLLDVLPHVGDTTVSKDAQGQPYSRHSEFPVALSGPLVVPAGFKVFYSLDLAPVGSDYSTFYETANWQATALDYSKVRALKVVMDEDRKLEVGDLLEVLVPLEVAKDYDLTDAQLAVNSFGVSTDAPDVTTKRYFESNNAPIEIVRYEVTGHVFHDQNLDSELGSTEPRFGKHTVVLVNDEGKPVLDLEGQPITTKTDENGYYKMDVYRQGKYRVKILPPEGFTLTAPKSGETMSNIYLDEKEHLSDAFTLSPATRKAIRNGGYYKDERAIYLYKYDASTIVDSNGDGVIDDSERRNGTPLGGAVFEVYEGTVVDPAKKLKNEDGTAVQLTTGPDGKVSFKGKLSGDYLLVEIKAPDGFELLKKPIVLKNVNTELADELWVYIANDVQTELPFTGSNRPFEWLLMTFTSFFLLGMSLIAYQWLPRRRKGGE